MIIEQPSIWLHWLYPRATWRMDKNERAVYLTFDDGPIPESTPFILKTLAEFDAKATFFMVGENVLKHHDLYNDIVEAGQPLERLQAFAPLIQRQHGDGERTDKEPPFQTAPRVDALGTVFLAGTQIPHCNVGPADARLQQMDYGRRYYRQRETLHAKRLDNNFPRLDKKHWQAESCPSRNS